ncbi:MAG: LacI family transcriptional regulator [Chloroflexota bacterium]|nr:LacI family transcriptional regulator [Chloroflexota bacterium]
MRDIAEATGLSLAAVSLALNGRNGVSDETRERVLAAAAEVGYVRRAERQPRPARGFIGFVIEQLPFPVFSDIFYGDVVHGIDQEAHALGFSTGFTVVEPERPVEARAKVRQMLLGNRARGLIVIGGSNLIDELVRDLAKQAAPLVLLDNYLYDLPLDGIEMDHLIGGYLATRHLIELGHREIGFIAGPAKYRTLSDRADGYRRALADAGIRLDSGLIVEPGGGCPGGAIGGKKGYHEMRELLTRRRPSAVFAVSDKAAFGAIDAIREAGLTIPDDISLVGFDDVHESSLLTPPLTTIAVPKRLMGRLAARLLADRIGPSGDGVSAFAKPTKLVVPVSLVVRESTRAALSVFS